MYYTRPDCMSAKKMYLRLLSCTEGPSTQIDENLTYKEEYVSIVDKQEWKLRSRKFMYVISLWRVHTIEAATWELENFM